MRIRILDGGTGSELRRRGVALSASCWSAGASLENPELLLEIHRDYIRAGADIVTANTFAATGFVLEAAGFARQRKTIVHQAMAAARMAAGESDRQIAVAGSISCLPPGFDPAAYPAPDAEYRAYAELADAIARAGADLIVLEMLQNPAHAALACRAAAATGLPYWAGVSCRFAGAAAATSGESGDPVLVGFDDPDTRLRDLLDTLGQFAPEAMAVMHTPVDAIPAAIRTLRSVWPGPMAAYAELPYPQDPDFTGRPAEDPIAYALAAREWIGLGASVVGGCCGTTPAHIAALRSLADSG